MKVWENLKKLWKLLPTALVPTAFLVLPNFHSCFYNSIETCYMFSISLMIVTINLNCRLLKMTQEVGTVEAVEGSLDVSLYPIGSFLKIMPYHVSRVF